MLNLLPVTVNRNCGSDHMLIQDDSRPSVDHVPAGDGEGGLWANPGDRQAVALSLLLHG